MKSASAVRIQSTLFAFALVALGNNAQATSVGVGLQQATATFSQSYSGDYSVGKAINGTLADNLGWAISPDGSANPASQTAVFETVTDIGFAGGSTLTFTLYQTHDFDFVFHTLGRFRLSVTTDDRSMFADGLASAGDVTANWTILDPDSFVSANGATLGKLADKSILASGFSPYLDIYTITANTSLTGITGIRLEALKDPSLPFNGPGRQPINGNFVLSEFEVSIAAVPEPSTGALVMAGCLTWFLNRRRQKPNPLH